MRDVMHVSSMALLYHMTGLYVYYRQEMPLAGAELCREHSMYRILQMKDHVSILGCKELSCMLRIPSRLIGNGK